MHCKSHSPVSSEYTTRQRPPPPAVAAPAESSQWWQWYMGAPGTLMGTAVALGLFAIVQAVPSLSDLVATRSASRTCFKVGALFLRAMTCTVAPLTLTSVVLSMAKIVQVPAVRGKLLAWMSVTMVLALAPCAVWAAVRSASLIDGAYDFEPGALTVMCPSASGTSRVLAYNATTKSLECQGGAKMMDKSGFIIGDTVYQVKPSVHRFVSFLTDSAQSADLVTTLSLQNIVLALSKNDVVSVVVFAVVFGLAVGLLSRADSSNYVLSVLDELHALFQIMTEYVTYATPLAMIPLILAPLLANEDSIVVSTNRLLTFLLAYIGLSVLHTAVVLPLVFAAATRTFPFKWYWGQLHRVYLYGFVSSSSLKTLPVAMRQLDRLVTNPKLARVALVEGTVLNKNGAVIYLVTALTWVFLDGGLAPQLTTPMLLTLLVSSVIGAVAVPPIRTGGVGIVVCLFQTMTNVSVPAAYAFLLLAEALIDPIATVTNIAGNIVVAVAMSEGSDHEFMGMP